MMRKQRCAASAKGAALLLGLVFAFSLIAMPVTAWADDAAADPAAEESSADAMENDGATAENVPNENLQPGAAGNLQIAAESQDDGDDEIVFAEGSQEQADNTTDIEMHASSELVVSEQPQDLMQAQEELPAGPLPDGDYVIRANTAYNSVLDVAGGSSASGANVQLYHYNGTPAQKWHFAYNPATQFYTITNLIAGMALDVSQGSTAARTNIQVYRPNGTPAQMWRIIADGTGWHIESALKPDFVLDISNGSADDRANVQGYNANGTPAQRFNLLATSPDIVNVAPSTAEIAEGAYTIVSALSNKVLDVASGSHDAGGNIQQYNSNATYAQRFYFEPDGSGFYRVFNVGSGLALDVAGAGFMPRTNVQQNAVADSAAQLWSLRSNDDGTYTFVSKVNNLALDIAGGSFDIRANVQVYVPNGTPAQRFRLTPVDLLSAGTTRLFSALAPSCLVSVASSSASEGAALQILNSDSGLSQKYTVAQSEGGYTLSPACSSLYVSASDSSIVQSTSPTIWALSFAKSGARRGIAFSGGNGLSIAVSSPENGAALILATTSGDIPQSFLPQTSSLIDNGIYSIESLVGNKVIDAAGGKRKIGTNVQIYTPNNTNAQKYYFTSLGDEWYTISNAASGRALDVKGGSAESGANVQLYRANGTNAQRWKAELVAGGSFRFVNAISGKVLDVADAQDVSGTNVQVADRSDSNGQLFRIYSTTLSIEAVDLGVPLVWQNPELPTGCESVALTEALMYYDFNLYKTEIADRYMPWSDDDFVYAYMGNPYTEYGAAIMAPGLTNTANSYLISHGSSLRASNVTGTSLDDLYGYIDAGCPVIIWSTIYFTDVGPVVDSRDGYSMHSGTHTITMSGYNADKTQVLIADPMDGIIWRDAGRFRAIYDAMGRQAVVIQ